jgi:hypothetical protein
VSPAELRQGDIPDHLTGVRWLDGTVECRFRVLSPSGSLVAGDNDQGEVLTDPSVECDRCSDACS